MASCYGDVDSAKACDGLLGQELVQHILPITWEINRFSVKHDNGEFIEEDCQIRIDFFKTEDERREAMNLMNFEIESGLSWPFDEQFSTYTSFSKYFMSHSAFVARVFNYKEKSKQFQQLIPHGVLGCFYIKPNFPGRCAHVCNGGFIVRKEVRCNGIGQRMGAAFLPLARDLGYSASFFNLVFVSNEVSDRMWKKLGYTQIGVIPKVARLKGFDDLVDAKQYYYDLSTVTEYKQTTNIKKE